MIMEFPKPIYSPAQKSHFGLPKTIIFLPSINPQINFISSLSSSFSFFIRETCINKMYVSAINNLKSEI